MTQLEAQAGERQPGNGRPGGPQPDEPQPGGLTLDAARFFAARLDASWVPAYLAGRGFGEPALRPWTVGYAPAGWRALISHLRDLGYGDAVIQAAGLARRTRRGALVDFFRARALFGIRWVGGRPSTGTGPGSGSAGRTGRWPVSPDAPARAAPGPGRSTSTAVRLACTTRPACCSACTRDAGPWPRAPARCWSRARWTRSR